MVSFCTKRISNKYLFTKAFQRRTLEKKVNFDDPEVSLQMAKKCLDWNQHERKKDNESLTKDNNIGFQIIV